MFGKMKRSDKYTILICVMICISSVGYFSTFGHVLLPLEKPTHFVGEEIELRSPIPILLPSNENTPSGKFQRAKWKLLHPGQKQLIEAYENLAKTNTQPTLQGALEKLGYQFPTNCYWQKGPFGVVAHYPSMLDRIEKDFGFQMKKLETPKPAKL